MTNLEWLRTLSEEEFADWLYTDWLHRLQYRYSSSRGGLMIWLKEDSKTDCKLVATDCISRQAVLNLAKDICVPTKDGYTYRHRCIDIDEVRELPSADAVEVVRCRDCKHVQTTKCPFFKAKWGYTDDDYCSCGERREDGEV